MQNKDKDWFCYDEHFRQWFRVLIRGGGVYNHQLEIPLTPGGTSANWDAIADPLIIRTDVRNMVDKNKSHWTHNLPDDVYYQIVKELGSPKANFLFDYNIRPLIDWNKFTRNDNQGCPLSLCRRDFTWCYEQTYLEGDAIVVAKMNEQSFLQMNSIHNTPDMLMIGGLTSWLPNNPLLIYGYYHIKTGYICFDLNYSVDGQNHTSKFSQRLAPSWETTLVDFIKDMKINGKITNGIENAIKNIISVANNNLIPFKLDNL